MPLRLMARMLMRYFCLTAQLDHSPSYPGFRHRRLIDGMVRCQLDVVKHMVRAVPDRGPRGRLLLRIDHIVRTVAQQEFGVDVRAAGRSTKGAPYSLSRAVVSREL